MTIRFALKSSNEWNVDNTLKQKTNPDNADNENTSQRSPLMRPM